MAEGAFEGTWDALAAESFICSACFCQEHLFTFKCCSPAVLGSGKVCCATMGIASGQDCIGEKGCLLGLSKFCCCVTALNSNNLAIGCCDVFCCGRPYGEGEEVRDLENEYMESVHWCTYCICAGHGCTYPSPCISSDVKICCLESKASTADECWDENGGCVNVSMKTCCFMNKVQCPPTMNIGLGCCCIPCIRSPDKSNAGQESC